NDVSVPISSLPRFLDEAGRRVAELAPGARPCPFGHLGDGNLHYNILGPAGEDPDAFRRQYGAGLVDAVSDLVMSMKGSFSAEHGVGRLRREMMERYKAPEALMLMRKLKQTLDPDGILNPGKVI
ncbi:MAG TPA: FAD-linked oxidase C-terminal domain-containing protein, partial [Arenicellales bacterium]|nr:FAD-linked oxidase C-terminal domain-containing protein [Arenicellales bacterium]